MRDQVVLRVLSKIIIPYIFLFGFYVVVHGESGPGGGFQGGVLVAAGLVFYSLIFGAERARQAVPTRVLHGLMALGLLLYVGVGFFGMVWGNAFLDYQYLSHDKAHAETLGMSLVEYGVGITVASVMVVLINRIAIGETD